MVNPMPAMRFVRPAMPRIMPTIIEPVVLYIANARMRTPSAVVRSILPIVLAALALISDI